MSFRIFLATALLLVMANAFVPGKVCDQRMTAKRTGALSFGFLKDLGLEKPSWLPDFGGGKKTEEPVAEDKDKEKEEEETTAPAEE